MASALRRLISRKSPKDVALFGHTDIVKAGHPALRQKALKIQTKDIEHPKNLETVDRLVALLEETDGYGMSAPQLGISQQIAVFQITPNDIEKAGERARTLGMEILPLMALYNFTVEARGSKMATHREGCLSVPGFSAHVARPVNVYVTGYTHQGDYLELDASGWAARVFQHEHDHLNGILYTDRMLPHTLAYTPALTIPMVEDVRYDGWEEH